MPRTHRSFQDLLAEVRRRRVGGAVLAYAAVVWVVLQVADVALPPLGVPDWALAALVIASLAGFPLVVGAAWVFQITAEGVVRTPAADPDAPGPSRRRLVLPTLLLLTGTAGLAWAGWYVLRPPASVERAGTPAVAELDPLAIAVLPFEVASMGGADPSFFAAGMHDAILSQLSRIGTLRVTSRTSVLPYAGSEHNIREIAEELKVGTVLEGTVQQAGETLRLTVQLIDARTDEHRWTDVFEERVSLENVFAIQAAIARQVAAALDQVVTPVQDAELAELPTRDAEAYEFFVRGNAHFTNRFAEGPTRLAIEMYERAVSADPGFALAWARLAEARSIYYSFFGRSPEQREAAAHAAERAVELQPDLSEARLARGYLLYWVFLDLERALDTFEAALERSPNDGEVLWITGSLKRRMGDFAGARDLLERAARLDPRSRLVHLDLAIAYTALGLSEEGLEQAARAIEVAPDWLPAYVNEAILEDRDGIFARADSTVLAAIDRFGAEEVLGFLASSSRALLAPRSEEILRQVVALEPGRAPAEPASLLVTQGDAWLALGDTAAAMERFEAARALLEPRLESDPGRPDFWGNLCLVYARLGRVDEAVRAARRATALQPASSDPLGGFEWEVALMRTLVITGRLDEAVAQVERLLRLPWTPSRKALRTHPWVADLLSHPPYLTLLDRLDREGS